MQPTQKRRMLAEQVSDSEDELTGPTTIPRRSTTQHSTKLAKTLIARGGGLGRLVTTRVAHEEAPNRAAKLGPPTAGKGVATPSSSWTRRSRGLAARPDTDPKSKGRRSTAAGVAQKETADRARLDDAAAARRNGRHARPSRTPQAHTVLRDAIGNIDGDCRPGASKKKRNTRKKNTANSPSSPSVSADEQEDERELGQEDGQGDGQGDGQEDEGQDHEQEHGQHDEQEDGQEDGQEGDSAKAPKIPRNNPNIHGATDYDDTFGDDSRGSATTNHDHCDDSYRNTSRGSAITESTPPFPGFSSDRSSPRPPFSPIGRYSGLGRTVHDSSYPPWPNGSAHGLDANRGSMVKGETWGDIKKQGKQGRQGGQDTNKQGDQNQAGGQRSVPAAAASGSASLPGTAHFTTIHTVADAPKPQETPKRPSSPTACARRVTKRHRLVMPQPSSSSDSFTIRDHHIVIADGDDNSSGHSPLPSLDSIQRVLRQREQLRGTGWLNDEVMASLLRRLNTETIGVADSLHLVAQRPPPRAMPLVSEAPPPKTPVIAKAEGGGQRTSLVPRYISALANKSIIIMPAHDKKSKHWRLYRWQRPEAGKELVLECFDPMAGMPRETTDEDARRLLRAVLSLPSDQPIPVHQRPCPQQRNGYDYGPYTIAMAYHLAAFPTGATISDGAHHRRQYDGPSLSAATLDGPALRRWLADILLTSPSATLPYEAVVKEMAPVVLLQNLCNLAHLIQDVKDTTTLHRLAPDVTGRTKEEDRKLCEAFWEPDVTTNGRLVFVSALRRFHRLHEVSLQASVAAFGRLQEHTAEIAPPHQFAALRRQHRHGHAPPSGNNNGSSETGQDVGDDERKLREAVGQALRLNVALVVVMKVTMQMKWQQAS